MIAQSAASSSSHLPTPPTAPVASGSSQVPSAPAPIPPQPTWMHLPTMVPSQWQQSPIPLFRAPPSHHLPLQQLLPIPSPPTSIPQPHLRQYYHPQPMLTGYYAVPPYQHSLGPALPPQPSAPVLTPNRSGPHNIVLDRSSQHLLEQRSGLHNIFLDRSSQHLLKQVVTTSSWTGSRNIFLNSVQVVTTSSWTGPRNVFLDSHPLIHGANIKVKTTASNSGACDNVSTRIPSAHILWWWPKFKVAFTGRSVVEAMAGSTRNRSITPDPGSGRSSNYLSIGGHGNNSRPQSSRSTSGEVLEIPEVGIQPPSSPTLSLDEPISAGIRRRRDSGPSNHGDPTKLTPQHTKRLKMHAKKACEENEVPQDEVMTFIDTGDIFYMLLDLKITLIKLCEGNKARRMQEIKDTLESKDFESQDFISKNQEIFKIPPGLLDDVELRAQLGKVVTKLLTNIRSAIKGGLTTSIVKRTSIADVTRSLARSGSGMEVDSTHWNRIALLRRLLQIFLIGVSDYKTASIEDLFSAYLIPSLKQDLRDKVVRELSIDVGQLEEDLFDADLNGTNVTGNSSQAPTQVNGQNGADMGDEQHVDQNGAEQDDLDANEEDESSNANGGANSANGAVLPDNPVDSGFGLVEGMPARYNSTIKFWNFVDDSLSAMRRIADESSSIATEQEKELQKLFIEVFQADLAEFPGGKKVSKLISKTNPRWQTTIQTGLIW
ncbi:hypothetical protein BD769DRAFT_1391922 [Suillus cothurnatus]|nr:hypothetical protein BD769DRAFT_1391922 [Suillus cothurnatus]